MLLLASAEANRLKKDCFCETLGPILLSFTWPGVVVLFVPSLFSLNTVIKGLLFSLLVSLDDGPAKAPVLLILLSSFLLLLLDLSMINMTWIA